MLKTDSKKFSVRKMAIIGMLGGITAILGLTPIGFIPVGPTKATIMHIPVIIGAIMEGPVVGVLVGLMFGIFSIIQAIMYPTILSPLFLDPLVSVLPRILIGVTAYYSYYMFKKLGRKTSLYTLAIIWLLTLIYLVNTLIKQYGVDEISIINIAFNIILILFTLVVGYFAYKKFKDQAVEIVISAVIGTLTNTVGVLSMIYILHLGDFVEKLGIDRAIGGKTIIGIAVANGMPETIVAMLIVTSVIMALRRNSNK